MALRGEVDHHITAGHRLLHIRGMADIAFDELVERIFLYILQVRQIARVGEFIEVDDFPVRPRMDEVMNEIRADKSRAAGDEYFHTYLQVSVTLLSYYIYFCSTAS